jgi:hypothetical protein
MSGLGLLCDYDSSSEESEGEPPPKLPLPAAVKNLYEKEAKELCPGIFSFFF